MRSITSFIWQLGTKGSTDLNKGSTDLLENGRNQIHCALLKLEDLACFPIEDFDRYNFEQIQNPGSFFILLLLYSL
ncbi:hypothetical protein HanHA300_Chr10g0354471 [Helianthus annuus]|nr:hypothetical protein HanHA300_Chr10g0354471 [Helianthus annuus]KAJ0520938.1 hypothetical protein HanIR_Chr10g0464971 [Helianthus annuus]KAJ0529303.1 hypothetical protein HanHA89_Chr10g0376161 [Helianthus annuus]KAJ0696186.1 hypothetical protein HanLR1_Chr10g0354031 [Helianthus annuus]